MREWLRFHSPTVGAFLALVVVAGALSLAMPVPSVALEGGSPLPATSIPLPGPGEDADGDSYADGVDQAEGDLQVGLRLERLSVPGADARPYVVLGTEDDHWRLGDGAELEWTHVVDPDSLGRRAGSPAWQDDVLRTGAWWMSRPGEALDLAIAATGDLDGAAPEGAHWPQTLWANVRDDRPVVRLAVELRDADPDPDAVRGKWDLEVHLGEGVVAVEGTTHAFANLTLTDGATRLVLDVLLDTGPGPEVLDNVTRRWAPTLRFDSQEAFYPARGDLLERFHGFTRRGPGDVDLRTWDMAFNHGRDSYRLFLADYNGDGDTSHLDAQVMADLLAAGDLGAPTVYAHAARTTDNQVVLQYWFLYFYNFVLDDAGDDIEALQHKGDREFVQLTFASWEAALNGTPSAVAFSQHYEGLLVTDPTPVALPLDEGRLVVHVARGSHATYPVPGDDRRLRSSLTSLFDRFDGEGRELDPLNYTLELLGGQPWHAGYKWGPPTRYTRDLGISARPLLQHDFRYPFTDPLWWQASLHEARPDQLEGMYGRPP